VPEPLLLIKAIALAAGLAACVQLLVWWIPRAVRQAASGRNQTRDQPPSDSSAATRAAGTARMAIGGAIGVGIGFVAGAWLLGQLPNWPPAEDRDRFFAILLPAAVLVECFCAVLRVGSRLRGCARLILSAAAVPILLYRSTYLAELAGPGSRDWTNSELILWLMSLAVVLAFVWFAAVHLLGTDSGRILPFALALAAGGAGVTIMLSGYLTGGELGLPLAGAIGGSAVAALGLRMLRCNAGAVGVGVVGLFGVLVMGRFFGKLTTVHGSILLAAPLLVCVSELLPRRISAQWLRRMLAAVVVVIPIAFVVAQAREKFVQDSASKSEPGEPSDDDYSEYK
jgi:MFS family permease